ncbi:hypothetical protein PR048_006638 [Dryococelus australis]|uniref:Uncharacterized protein n=1 Tax=Dryococelus australis TaxID=614101 RepID=A0ABQ9IBK9_9NEOP|nr:hypothetical protein PR048_006638 [Dryococelus australis]
MDAERLASGQFYTIMSELKGDNSKFLNYFRMRHKSFKDLLDLLKMDIQKVDTNMRRSIPIEERLAITLRNLLLTIQEIRSDIAKTAGVELIANIQMTCGAHSCKIDW